MIAIRTKNLSPLFTDILGFEKFLKSMPEISLVISPEDGVDWELSGAIPGGTSVYSLIPHIKGSEETIKSHTLALGVSSVIPLFPVSENYEGLRSYPEYGVYGAEDVEEILELEEVMGKLPDIVRISINPLKYPKELIDFCKSNNIKILGTDIFGSDILKEYYKNLFPDSFLQAFGEYNANIIEVPGNDPYFIKEAYQRSGKKQDNPNLFKYSKYIDKTPPLKVLPRKVHQVLSLEVPGVGKLSISGGKGDFTLEPVSEVFDLGDPLWEDDLIPEDVDLENKELLGTLHRYHVLPVLQELHSQKIWKPIFTKIQPDFWAIKVIPKKWMGWVWKEYLYWMVSGKLWKIPLSAHENLING